MIVFSLYLIIVDGNDITGVQVRGDKKLRYDIHSFGLDGMYHYYSTVVLAVDVPVPLHLLVVGRPRFVQHTS